MPIKKSEKIVRIVFGVILLLLLTQNAACRRVGPVTASDSE